MAAETPAPEAPKKAAEQVVEVLPDGKVAEVAPPPEERPAAPKRARAKKAAQPAAAPGTACRKPKPQVTLRLGTGALVTLAVFGLAVHVLERRINFDIPDLKLPGFGDEE